MKRSIKILLIVFITALWGCEKNDPLAEQGTLTGNSVPFNLLAQMADAAAGDTLNLRNVAWAIDDNIENVSFFHRGFKLRNYEFAFSVETDLNGVSETYEMEYIFAEDSILFEAQRFAQYPENGQSLDQYYQTLENAYVIVHEFIVPDQYKISKEVDGELILALNETVYSFITDTLGKVMNRPLMVTIFPNLSPFNVTYFEFDSEGNFTNNLKPAGVAYFLENITRERLNDFLDGATVSDNTRVTIETEAILKGATLGAKSQRTFRVI